jgi:hypothetical protein
MHFLVIDGRYGTPIYVLLEVDPRGERGFPALAVREVTLELRPAPARSGPGVGTGAAVGRDPARLDRFREFGSSGAVAVAGFILIEPRYIGPSWPSYLTAFRPEGEKPVKHRALRPAGSPAASALPTGARRTALNSSRQMRKVVRFASAADKLTSGRPRRLGS